MIRAFTLLLILTTWCSISRAQEKTYLDVSLNKGIGFNYKWVRYYYNSDGSTHKMPYSAGGGLGIQVNYGKYMNTTTAVTAGIGYQQILAFPYEESREDLLASFNYTSFALGLNLDILKTEKLIETVTIGAGFLLAAPGKLRRTEEDIKQRSIRYSNSYGGQFNSNIVLDPLQSKNFKLNASLGYKHISFSSISSHSPASLKELNGNGLFLTFGLRVFL